MMIQLSHNNNCIYDSEKGTINFNGEEKRLHKFYKMFSCLVENPGKLFSYEELQSICSDKSCTDEGISDNTRDLPNKYVVERMKKIISNLRTKYNLTVSTSHEKYDPYDISIKNESGVGYKLYLSNFGKVAKRGNKGKEQENTKRKNNKKDRNEGDNNIVRLIRQFAVENINNSIELLNFDIDEMLLPTCDYYDMKKCSMHDVFHSVLKQGNNVFFKADGGIGKSTSFIYWAKKLMEEDDSVIAIYIPIKELALDSKDAIWEYIIQNINIDEIVGDAKEVILKFQSNFKLAIKKNNCRLLLLLDGVNEKNIDIKENIKHFCKLKNCSIILSSRYFNNEISMEYVSANVNDLSLETVTNYLLKNNIECKNTVPYGLLTKPFFLSKYVDVLKKKRDGGIEVVNKAKIIDKWINDQILIYNEKKTIHSSKLALNIFLPLYAIFNYMVVDYTQHKAVEAIYDNFNKLCKEIAQFVCAPHVRVNINIVYKVNIPENVNECWLRFIQLKNALIDSKYAFFIEKDGKYYWQHEYFRDWFIAKGLLVLRDISKEKYKEVINEYITTKFDYPKVFKEHHDYVTYNVGNIFLELSSRDKILSDESENMFWLIPRVVFYADDIGDHNTVITYWRLAKEYIDNKESVHSKGGIDSSKDIQFAYCKARIYTGLARCLTALRDISGVYDLYDEAYALLCEAFKNIRVLFVDELSNNDDIGLDKLWFIEDDLCELSIDEIDEYYIDNKEYIKEQIKINHEDIDEKAVLDLLARICGNLGAYYILQYYHYKDSKKYNSEEKKTMTAFYSKKFMKMHINGYLIKKIILDICSDKVEQDYIEGILISYRSMADDKCLLGDFKSALDIYIKGSMYLNRISDSNSKIYIFKVGYLRTVIASGEKFADKDDLMQYIDEVRQCLDSFEKAKMMREIGKISLILKPLSKIISEMKKSNKKIVDRFSELEKQYKSACKKYMIEPYRKIGYEEKLDKNKNNTHSMLLKR